MMKNLRNIVFGICHVLFCIMVLVKGSKDDERKAYVVYMGELQDNNGDKLSGMEEHHHILSDVVGDEMVARKSKIHSYGKSFNGFAAHLLPHEADKLREKENVISVFADETIKLLTTRSWEFIGMSETVQRNRQVESNIIVGLIDTGIYMDSPSFDDKGFGPPPKKWKGTCEKGANFTGCNNKVIGAQVLEVFHEYAAEYDRQTPADYNGHGTICASIAGGNAVAGANLFGILEGTARGGVPSARLAIYKSCFNTGCSSTNVLAGFDKAIADGVDIISLSVASVNSSNPYFEDVIAIGTFHALKKGILSVVGAGNDGPSLFSVANAAPWITTVGANGVDKDIQTLVKLGNGKVYSGMSVNEIEPEKQMYPLTSGVLAGNSTKGTNSSGCVMGTMSEQKVKGAIVYCVGGFNGDSIKHLHGTGLIASSGKLNDVALARLVPSLTVNKSDGEAINQYINSTKSPSAVIYKTTTVNRTAPYMGSFSSRGPQLVTLNILKPDVSAPGVNILAASTPLISLSGAPKDKRFMKYKIESGTSMSTPFVAGAAAYVKSFHPEWSPAAIKSALMTTAKSMKVEPLEGALTYGSGMINPAEAINPGLVYDIDFDSYISFLCKEGYNSTTLAILAGTNSTDCSKVKPAKGADGLNYPSMHLQLQKQNSSSFSAIFYRTVTNVGEGKSLYKANIESPKDLSISVVPKMLSFTKPNQILSFKVDVKGKFVSEKSWLLSASLVWSDSSNHNVRSPIIVFRNTTLV